MAPFFDCDGPAVLAVALSALRPLPDGDAWPMGQGSVSQKIKRSEGIGRSAKAKAGPQAHPQLALGQGTQYVLRCDATTYLGTMYILCTMYIQVCSSVVDSID